MAIQSFIYNSNTTAPNPNIEPIFNVKAPALLRAAGLQVCVPIYMMVGDCPTCRPNDVLWAPLMCAGKPVKLCPDVTQILLAIPGKYSFGNPLTAPLVLVGDVNVTKEDGVDASLVGKPYGNCCDDSEINQYQTAAIPVTFGCGPSNDITEQWYTFDVVTFNTTTGIEISRIKYWTNGVITTDVQPCAVIFPFSNSYATSMIDVSTGTYTVNSNANLIGWTVRNRTSTTGTIKVNTGSALVLDYNESISSGGIEEERSLLNDTIILTAGDGIIRVIEIRRI
jgi:hypothetical protein